MLLPSIDFRFVLLRCRKTNLYQWTDSSIHLLHEDAVVIRNIWQSQLPTPSTYHDIIFTMRGFEGSTKVEEADIIGYNLLRMSGKLCSANFH